MASSYGTQSFSLISSSSSSSSSSPPSSSLSSSFAPMRRRAQSSPHKLNQKRLTSRVVELTRRRQLRQVMEEIDAAKRRYGKLNTIAMNAVLEACVHCGDVESARKVFDEMSRPSGSGIDGVSYAILLKGLGEAGRIDEAFQILESVEGGTAAGKPKLSGPLIFGLLNALVESGDLRRANALLSRYGFFLREGGSFSVMAYNILMKGFIKTGSPECAIATHNEMLSLGLSPDRLTYNTLISACVKTRKLDMAMGFFEEMKDKALKSHGDLLPDVVTYTTLLKVAEDSKDLFTVHKIVLEMKTSPDCHIDRTAYTATVDALLSCGSINAALCIFGEILKLAGRSKDFRPKPHLYLSMMRAFAGRGDFDFVKKLHDRILPDTCGTIYPPVQEEADHLLMEAALNNGQVALAVDLLSQIITKWKGISWTSRGGFAATRLESVLGFTTSMFSPYILPQISLEDSIENFMTPFEAAKPLHEAIKLKHVISRLTTDSVVPIIDDLGSCIGLLHQEDCKELDAPLWTMMRCPPPTVTTMTSIGHVLDLLVEKRHEMVIVVNSKDSQGSDYSSCPKAVGFFAPAQLADLVTTFSNSPHDKPSICRTL